MVRRLFGAVCALVAFATAASAADLQKISVGYVPVADFAPLFVAKDKGFFEQHGLDVTLTKILLASNVPGALVAGSLDIGMGTPPMLLVTNESGLDFEAIAAVSRLEEGQSLRQPDRAAASEHQGSRRPQRQEARRARLQQRDGHHLP